MARVTPISEVVTNQELATAFLKRNPDVSSLGAAKRLKKDYPKSFASVDAARSCIRRCRGAHGKKNRRPGTEPKTKFSADNPLGFPEPVAVDYDPFYLKGTKTLILSDIHVPFHSLDALTLAIRYGKEFGPDVVFINGDLMDFPRLSRFNKDPEARDVFSDLADGYKLLQVIRKNFPKAKLVYKFGNHDEWFSIYVRKLAPELADLPSLWLEEQYWYERKKLSDLGIEVIKDGRKCFAGKLPILHGHELGMKSINVNPARTAFLKCGDCVMVSHLHKGSQHTETNIHGKLITTWSTACLCQLYPRFARVNKWHHGFSTVENDRSGAFNVTLKTIYKGAVW